MSLTDRYKIPINLAPRYFVWKARGLSVGCIKELPFNESFQEAPNGREFKLKKYLRPYRAGRPIAGMNHDAASKTWPNHKQPPVRSDG